MRILISIGFIILLSSCATTTTNYYSQTVQGWRGGNAQTLVSVWGTPDSRTAGPNGTIIYTYKTENYRANTGRYSPSVGVSFTRGGAPAMTTQPSTNFSIDRGLSLSCTTMFVVDRNGKIVDTQSQGNNCNGSASFSRSKGNPKPSY